ncbi:MAG: HAMP domain-containing protein [Ferruginibacter sp.]|nr:HAMP domain-containing protein [Cytophagales bacterium]
MPSFLRSLQAKLLFGFLAFLLLTSCVALASWWFFQKREKLGLVTANLDGILIQTLQAIRAEQDFLRYGALDANFYQTGASPYLDEHARRLTRIRQDLRKLSESEAVKRFDIQTDARLLQVELNGYESVFKKLVEQIKTRGFKDYGLEGEMRWYAHAIEGSSYPFDRVQLLTLRRHEKDYIIRHDLGYADKFRNTYHQMRRGLSAGTDARSGQFDSLLTNYHRVFKELVRVEGMIGYGNASGLQAQLRRSTDRMENQTYALITEANHRSNELREIFWGFSTLMLAASVVLLIFFSYLTSRWITQPIRSLTRQVNELMNDNFHIPPQPLRVTSRDEMAVLTHRFNFMIREMSHYLGQIQEKSQALAEQNEALRVVNQQLAQSEVALRKLNAVKDKFFFIISHDLKGPLSALSGFLQVLKSDVDSFTRDQLKEVALNMNASVHSLLGMLNNLLQWTVTQTGELNVRFTTIVLTNAVNENLQLLSEMARMKDIRLLARVEGRYRVKADQNMLDSVLRNLISNAIKFTEPGGEITVTAEEREDLIQVTVADTGVGIGKEDLERLFQQDTYHSTLGTSQEKGTGFGLLLCKDFVERNGGSIVVRSELGKGTAIAFTLPTEPVSQLMRK